LGAAFLVLSKIGQKNIIDGAQNAVIIVSTLVVSSLLLSMGKY